MIKPRLKSYTRAYDDTDAGKAIRDIYFQLQGIDPADLTKAEKNIVNILNRDFTWEERG